MRLIVFIVFQISLLEEMTELVGGVQTTFTWTISQGIYSISALQEEINRATQEKCQRTNLFVLDPDESSSHVYIHFMSITATIDCTVTNYMMSITGYPTDSGILGPVLHNNNFYEGNKAQLNNIQNIYLLCSFVNGWRMQCQKKFSIFTPDVSPFSTIMYRVLSIHSKIFFLNLYFAPRVSSIHNES